MLSTKYLKKISNGVNHIYNRGVDSPRVDKLSNGVKHIYNRGVDSPRVDKLSNGVRRKVFLDEKDYLRFLRSMQEFNRLNPVGSLYEKDYRDKKMDYNKKESKKESNSQLGIGFLESPKIILKEFKNKEDYKNYVDIVIKESSKRKEEIKEYLLE